jgi:uncharacterized protein YdhG (YjbR/CyaY superfamily)
MSDMQTKFETIDAYIASFPSEVQIILQEIRLTVQQAAPAASEKISYAMPTFALAGNLVHFAAFKKHIGFYPTASGTAKFQHEISSYKNSKGAIQFPLGQPMPLDLIAQIVKFRLEENLASAAAKAKKARLSR